MKYYRNISPRRQIGSTSRPGKQISHVDMAIKYIPYLFCSLYLRYIYISVGRGVTVGGGVAGCDRVDQGD